MLSGATFKDIEYCYIDVNGDRKIKIISDQRGGGIGYRFEDGVLRIWLNSDNKTETRVFPTHRVEYVREIERLINKA